MKAKIHFTMPDGFEDSLIIEADDLKGLQEQAAAEIKRRNAADPWSEDVE